MLEVLAASNPDLGVTPSAEPAQLRASGVGEIFVTVGGVLTEKG
jgi:hypothetical protein